MDRNQPIKALIIINLQNDFFGKGANPVPNALSILPVITDLKNRSFNYVIFTKLWQQINDLYVDILLLGPFHHAIQYLVLI